MRSHKRRIGVTGIRATALFLFCLLLAIVSSGAPGNERLTDDRPSGRSIAIDRPELPPPPAPGGCTDTDGDGFCDDQDNCIDTPNPLQGPPVKLNGPVASGGNVIEQQISPDGSFVVYLADQDTDEQFELYSAPADGTGVSTKLNDSLVAGGDVSSFRIGPDSTRVVYRADQDTDDFPELYSVPIGGGLPPIKLSSPLVGSAELYVVSPDSSTVVYLADPPGVGEGLYSVPIGGGTPVQLAFSESFHPALVVTADSSTVLYSADLNVGDRFELFAVPIGGGTSTRLNDFFTTGTQDVFDFAATSDSSTVVFRIDDDHSTGNDELHSVPIGGGPTVRLDDPPPHLWYAKIVTFSLSPDDSTVVYEVGQREVSSPEEVHELFSVPITGGVPVKLNGTIGPILGDVIDHGISPDSQRVIYRADQDINDIVDLYSVPIGGGFATKLNPIMAPDGDVFDWAVSPDSSTVVYRADQEVNGREEIYAVPITGGAQIRLNDTPIYPGGVTDYRIGADGSFVVYLADRVNGFWLDIFEVPITGGPNRALRGPFFNDRDVEDFSLSSDDATVAYTANQELASRIELYGAAVFEESDRDGDGAGFACDCDDLNPNCRLDCTDDDIDGYCFPLDCDDSLPNCTADCSDLDGDGFCIPEDCDDADPDCGASCDDADGDGLRACNGDCDDSNPLCTTDCTDADGDGACVTHDCDESNPNCGEDCTDGDGDGFCVGIDCNDGDPQCSVDCFDLDNDDACADIDCDEFNANCTTDCTDADGDGFCVTHDCDDTVATCTVDCTDADGDGLRLCEGDCDDSNGNCTTDCTDADGDGFCVVEDCDDGTFSCNVSCIDADGDGVRVCDGDCNDGNAMCTFDCTDVDGDGICIPQDCDDGDVDCSLDCSDDDGDGLWACQGDCDDENPNALPGLPEVCADNADNDCNGLTDGEEAFCAQLETSNLLMAQNSPATLGWDPATNADAYAVYRGRIPRTGFAGFNHVCEATLLSGTSATDPDIPRRGEGFYYLVTGLTVQSELIGGPLGTGSSGAYRPDSDSITCGPRVHVDPDNLAGPNDGLSWATAYTSLSDALRHGPYDNRGSEIWVRAGGIEGGAFASVTFRPGARVLGGFDGTESGSWERPAAGPPTVVDNNGFGSALWVSGMSVALERMTLQDAGTGVLAQPSGALLELSGITTQQISGYGVDLGDVGPLLPRLVMEDSFLDATSGLGGLRAVSEGGTLSGLVRGNTIAGGSDAGMRLEAHGVPLGSDATVSLDVIANTVTGGNAGIVLGADMEFEGLTATQASFVASNLVHDTSGNAVVVEASGASLDPGASVVSRPLIVGNTVSDSGGAGVMCSASRSGANGDVRAEPELWDNLITFHAGPGVEETADDEPNGVVAEPLLVGNDLFGNLSLYRDEGATDLTLIDDVNQFPGNYDNYDDDPGYRDRPADDYHLSIGTVLGIGSPMVYLANQSDPGIGMSWTGSFDDSSWDPGAYGVGYDTGPLPNAQNLILTTVPAGTLSIYTRVAFNIDDVGDVIALTFGSDHDDGVVAWINGVEVFRSASMPAGPLLWNSSPSQHESSNGDLPVYEEHDVSTLGIPALQTGPNVLAVGVWNTDAGSDDLVLVPRLIVNQEFPPIDAGHLEAPRLATEDIDGGLRILDGLRDFVGRPDTGADERQ